MKFDINNINSYDERKVERLLIILGEKFVGFQFYDGNEHMIKATVNFEDTELVYKQKKNSMDSYRWLIIMMYVLQLIMNY